MVLENVKAWGFDLDHTLWQDSPEIRALQRGEIYKEINKHLDLPLEEAKRTFEETYARLESAGRALVEMGIPDGRNLLRDCLKRADISTILERDQRLVDLLDKIQSSADYTFLITESRQDDAERKLRALGIDTHFFNSKFYWDNTTLRKDTGTVYPAIFQMTGLRPEEHVYVGNSLRDDVRPAKEAGLKTILVGSESEEADLSVVSLYELDVYI